MIYPIIGLLWNVQQDVKIERADEKSTQAVNQSNRYELSILELQSRADRMALVIGALWEIVHNKLNISEQEFSELVTKIDAADGKIDGKRTKNIQYCTHCGCAISNTFKKCLMCGEPGKDISEMNTI